MSPKLQPETYRGLPHYRREIRAASILGHRRRRKRRADAVSERIRNYRDWTTIDVRPLRQYWFAIVIAFPFRILCWDEQWDRFPVQQHEADIAKHLAALKEFGFQGGLRRSMNAAPAR